MPAAIDTNRCRRVTCGRISASTACITCGFTASTTISLSATRVLVVGRASDAVRAREAGELPRLGIARPQLAGPIAFGREQALGKRTGHVAGADESDLAHRRHVLSRGPKIAVPTRTSVAPSSIAASKSPLIPIDSSRRRRRFDLTVAQCAERPEALAHRRRVVGRGDRHQPLDSQPRVRTQRGEELRQIRRREAVLGSLVVEVDLHEHPDRHAATGTRGVERGGDTEIRERVHEARLGDRRGLVALDPADEVPLDAADVRERGPFGGPLLDIVLAEDREAGRHRGTNDAGILSFGHAHQTDVRTRTTGAPARRRDPLFHRREAHAQRIRHRRSHSATSGSGSPITFV